MCEISVVIPVLNGAATISEQLDAVLSQEGVEHFEVIVVDNGSSDGTVGIVSGYGSRDSRVRLIDGRSAPKGGAAAKNLGVRAARSGLIAFCDADDVVRPGWLQAIRTSLLSHPVVQVTREYWSLNPHLSRKHQPETRLSGVVFGAPAISGGAFGIRKDAYLGLGGFDESFKGAVDDEFSVRLMRGGYASDAAPGAVVSVRLLNSPLHVFRRQRLLLRSAREIEVRYGVRTGGYSWSALAKTAAALVLHVDRLCKRSERSAWAQTAGSLIGRLESMVLRFPARSRLGGR